MYDRIQTRINELKAVEGTLKSKEARLINTAKIEECENIQKLCPRKIKKED